MGGGGALRGLIVGKGLTFGPLAHLVAIRNPSCPLCLFAFVGFLDGASCLIEVRGRGRESREGFKGYVDL